MNNSQSVIMLEKFKAAVKIKMLLDLKKELEKNPKNIEAIIDGMLVGNEMILHTLEKENENI